MEERDLNGLFWGIVGVGVVVGVKCYGNLEEGIINLVGVWESFFRGGSI